MLTTGAFPMSPFLNTAGMGALLLLVALGGLVALVARAVLHRDGAAPDPVIEVLDGHAAAEEPRRRVS